MTRDPSCETIVAPATGIGRSPLAVVRISGGEAAELAGRVISTSSGRSRLSPRRATLVDIVDRHGAPMDRGLALFFPAPRSVTGEDVVEISCHGAPAVVEELVATLVGAGARPAEPGEFTLRALRHGKIDLTQAEAIADLVASDSVAQARIAARQLEGEVTRELLPLAERIADLLADVEAGLDFAEEEQDQALSPARVAEECRQIVSQFERLARASRTAHRVREGARVVLRGPVNAGKSSVFNMLMAHPRAIVTAEPGTTRDLIEESLDVQGLPVVICDAAGLREADSAAEREGVRRAEAAAQAADLILEVYDMSRSARPPVPPSGCGPPALLVATHADLVDDSSCMPSGAVPVDALRGVGREELLGRIAEILGAPGASPVESVALATERHRASARRASEALAEAAATAESRGEAELVAVHIRDAVDAVRTLLGEVGPEELLGRIFARFCVGK